MRNEILAQQRRWAAARGLATDAQGYCLGPEQNLPWLSPDIHRDFDAADGNEFGRNGARGKIAALHSSSALAVNVFGYWRSRDKNPLRQALGFAQEIKSIAFEQKFPTGVSKPDPNIDVVINGAEGRLLAIESKFCESFGSKPKGIRDKYYPAEAPGWWEQAGLRAAQKAVEQLRAGTPFEYIDAPQLLKHMLGLAQQPSADWHLMLLWYVPARDLQAPMDAEAERFQSMLGSDGGRFSWLSYQSLWKRLCDSIGRENEDYREYLQGRYFC
jgi:hypothetical protein